MKSHKSMRKLTKKEWEYNEIIQRKDNNEYIIILHRIYYLHQYSLSLMHLKS